MAKIWEEYRGYRLCQAYVNLATRSTFRSVRVEGLENVPSEGAVLLAPNHCATLMDPLLMLVALRRPVGFGARSDIFANPRVARILRWLRIVPLARERNGLSEVAKNFAVFDEIIDCIGHDVPFCMYAEGTHRPERGMLPVKKAIFRIARMAREQLGKPVYIVPVGVNYEYFFRGQGRVRIRFGAPIEIGEAFARHEGRPEAEIYHALCEELREADLALIGEEMTRRHGRKLLRALVSVLLLPLFVLCAAGSLLIWLPLRLIMHGIKDKAWTHTVRFALHFLFPLFWIFHIGFERILGYWQDLAEDLKG